MSRGSFIRSMLLSTATRVTMTILRLLRNILLARLLGPADRGLFALFSTLPDLIAALTSGGLNTAVGYQAARHKPIGVLLTQVLVYGCLLATLFTLLFVVTLRTLGQGLGLSQDLGLLAWLLLLAVPLAVLKSGLLTLHNADGQVHAFNTLRLLESLLPLLLFIGLWLIWRDAPLGAAVASWLGGVLLVVVLGLCWLARFHSIRLRWQPREQGELLRYSGRSHPNVIFQEMLMRADYLLIGSMLPPSALGEYALASAAAELLLIIPEAVTTPLMKRLLQQGEGIDELTPFALRLTASVMLVACLGMAAIGEWLIVLLFGAPYAPAYPALLALLPGLFGLCYASILRLDLLGKQRPGALSIMMGLAVALNLALNLVLIPSLGIVGAGIASSVAYLAVTLAMLVLYCRLSGVPWQRTLILLPEDIRQLRDMLRPREATC
ncbi:lipopolysaccharide biosynthesis protein [Pseudomonas panipatensis]|jgi:O-antigen/teichoic acid export membrane protein|uniref:Membrane protein involved in the export of O-antigen and teichoic acid n=1 Tax=Pseudomonas panipatensis TaxID=428992 RepID=A0A1G8IN91_9PSED|nr:oligosaccharide flippase family protein [Pseudomonas panipatensis]SDI20257.1 Membrane protein involved in the export of O-antigen and teichoic acid [Pseudomonas panipatensis]SMP73458.1 Membrane protein involved in the export of O-antigen and teichoic acid [Pseudomonas panipatensis]